MAIIPSENALAAGIGLYREGFTFVQNRRKKHRSDIFQISLLGMKVICFGGEDAARTFYDVDKFMRKGAVPPPVQHTLTGRNAIHTTDGAVHRNRKEMMLSLMTPESIAHLTTLVSQELNQALPRWENKPTVQLFSETAQVLCRAICAWSGVPLQEKEVRRRAADFVAMVDAFGNVGLRNIKGQLARHRAEYWIKGIIEAARNQELQVPEGTALHLIAHHRNTKGQLFNKHMAAVELINILRPTVAIAWYITFGAKALHEYPAVRQKFIDNQGGYCEWFVHELRRFYPFAPVMGAKVKHDFEWQGYAFPQGALVLLDMYGTNHDERLWEQATLFNPDRFNDRPIKPFDFLAQGGGDVHEGHRCPGEWITIEVLKTVLGFMVEQLDYTVPPQDLSYDLSRVPTLPKSGFIMANVHRKAGI